jgi:two-component system, NarL family, nitrate/nitrite response regulator NarL
MNSRINVMMVEDHPEYRETLEFVLGKEKDINLISQFGNAEQALRSLQDQTGNKIPDIVLLDLNLPGMSGLDAMPWFSKYAPEAKVIILSQSDMEADVLRAVQQGAAGYLLKSSTMDEIKQGIRTVNDGGATLEPGLARFILNTLQPKLPKAAVESEISARELEILTLVGDGLSQKKISYQLKISTYTVTDHLKHIYEKLQVANAPQAISKAYKTGILPTDE